MADFAVTVELEIMSSEISEHLIAVALEIVAILVPHAEFFLPVVVVGLPDLDSFKGFPVEVFFAEGPILDLKLDLFEDIDHPPDGGVDFDTLVVLVLLVLFMRVEIFSPPSSVSGVVL